MKLETLLDLVYLHKVLTNPMLVANYHPQSEIVHAGRVLERLIVMQLQQHS